MTRPAHAARNRWIDIALFVLIGITGVAAILFIVFTVAIPYVDIPPSGQLGHYSAPTGPRTTSHHPTKSPAKRSQSPGEPRTGPGPGNHPHPTPGSSQSPSGPGTHHPSHHPTTNHPTRPTHPGHPSTPHHPLIPIPPIHLPTIDNLPPLPTLTIPPLL